jgi:hypothetical protein
LSVDSIELKKLEIWQILCPNLTITENGELILMLMILMISCGTIIFNFIKRIELKKDYLAPRTQLLKYLRVRERVRENERE